MNKQQQLEQDSFMKKALWQYHDDVLNQNLPNITLTHECEAIYLRAYICGSGNGLEVASGILSSTTLQPEMTAEDAKDILSGIPTIDRYGITDENNMELLN